MTKDRDTQPPEPPGERPTFDQILTVAAPLLSEIETRFVGHVGQIVDPVLRVVQHVAEDLLRLRHEVRTRFDSIERRMTSVELFRADIEAWRRDLEERCRKCDDDGGIGDGDV